MKRKILSFIFTIFIVFLLFNFSLVVNADTYYTLYTLNADEDIEAYSNGILFFAIKNAIDRSNK